MSKASDAFAATVGAGLQIIPTAWVVITDTLPSWARIMLATFLVLWFITTAMNNASRTLTVTK